MFYQNMPLYLKLINLLKKEYSFVHQFPKEYKFSLGQDIIQETWSLIDLFIEAQIISQTQRQMKLAIIKKMDYQYDLFKLRIRFLSELKLISAGQSAALNEHTVEIGKMIGSWLKNG